MPYLIPRNTPACSMLEHWAKWVNGFPESCSTVVRYCSIPIKGNKMKFWKEKNESPTKIEHICRKESFLFFIKWLIPSNIIEFHPKQFQKVKYVKGIVNGRQALDI